MVLVVTQGIVIVHWTGVTGLLDYIVTIHKLNLVNTVNTEMSI